MFLMAFYCELGRDIRKKNMHDVLMYYLKHEQQCFIRYKDTRRSRESLGLIKHALRANVLNCFKNDRSSTFIRTFIVFMR